MICGPTCGCGKTFEAVLDGRAIVCPHCGHDWSPSALDLGKITVTEEMVTRFLNWPLPKSVLPDPCVMDRDYPHRIGTNLLTAHEARQMLERVLNGHSSGPSVQVAGGGAWLEAAEKVRPK